MSDVNEAAQWAAILFIGIFALGLTRQLGRFLVPRENQLPAQGPPVGADLVSRLPTEIATRVADSISHTSALSVLVVTRERCSGCEILVDRLRASSPAFRVTAIVTEAASDDYLADLRTVFSEVARDTSGKAARQLLVTATPVIFVLDNAGRIVHKQLGGDVDHAMAHYRRQGEAADRGDDARSGMLAHLVLPDRGVSHSATLPTAQSARGAEHDTHRHA
jgi:hypothetical protein